MPPCAELFCPLYSLAVSPDPLLAANASGSGGVPPEVHVAVGLDSGLNASDAARKPLNLVVLLDVSGSMGSSFDTYYYDQAGQQQQLTAEGRRRRGWGEGGILGESKAGELPA